MWDQIREWFDKPFDAQGTAFNWFMFIGLLIVITFLWGRILAHIREVTE